MSILCDTLSLNVSRLPKLFALRQRNRLDEGPRRRHKAANGADYGNLELIF